VKRVPLSEIKGGGPAENARRMESILGGADDPAVEALALNAGAAIWIAGIAGDLESGVVVAREVLAKGKALETLEGLVRLTAPSRKAAS
jgi:anthranilate phosphoribosyltransferase